MGSFSVAVLAFVLVSAAIAATDTDASLAFECRWGGTATNSITGESGTLLNGATFVADRHSNLDGAVRFNGDNSFVKFPPSAAFQVGTGNYTIVMWVQVSGRGLQRLFSHGSFYCSQGIMMRTADVDGKTVAFIEASIPHSCEFGIAGAMNLRDEKWHLVMGIVDRASRTASIYVDGKLDASGSAGLGNYDNSFGMAVGKSDEYDLEPLHGTVGTTKLYKRAFTGAEAASYYEAEMSTCTSVFAPPLSSLDGVPQAASFTVQFTPANGTVSARVEITGPISQNAVIIVSWKAPVDNLNQPYFVLTDLAPEFRGSATADTFWTMRMQANMMLSPDNCSIVGNMPVDWAAGVASENVVTLELFVSVLLPLINSPSRFIMAVSRKTVSVMTGTTQTVGSASVVSLACSTSPARIMCGLVPAAGGLRSVEVSNCPSVTDCAVTNVALGWFQCNTTATAQTPTVPSCAWRLVLGNGTTVSIGLAVGKNDPTTPLTVDAVNVTIDNPFSQDVPLVVGFQSITTLVLHIVNPINVVNVTLMNASGATKAVTHSVTVDAANHQLNLTVALGSGYRSDPVFYSHPVAVQIALHLAAAPSGMSRTMQGASADKDVVVTLGMVSIVDGDLPPPSPEPIASASGNLVLLAVYIAAPIVGALLVIVVVKRVKWGKGNRSSSDVKKNEPTQSNV